MAYRNRLLIGMALLAVPSISLPSKAPRPTQPSVAVVGSADTIIVTRPTAIAAFVVTQSEVDSSPELGEALSDFQYALPGIRDSLRLLGAVLVERYDSLIPIRDRSTRWTWRVRADSGGVGYLFVAPHRRPRVMWGVMTNSDMLDAFTRFLAQR